MRDDFYIVECAKCKKKLDANQWEVMGALVDYSKPVMLNTQSPHLYLCVHCYPLVLTYVEESGHEQIT